MTTRRNFVAGLAASAAALSGLGGVRRPADFVWADLLHFATNMWGDDGLTPGVHSYANKPPAPPAKRLKFDEAVWKRLTAALTKAGGNMVVIDVGDAVRCPSHPEIALEDAWTPDRLNAEVRRLKGLGLEPIPKLNFSTTHDQWLKVYNRMVGTPKYYACVAGVIADVCDIFEKPRFFHLGMDEEDYDQAKGFTGLGIFRRGTAWWHDVRFYAECCEKGGARPWMFSDYHGAWPDDFEKNCPKSVVQSPWYYKTGFDRNPDSDKKASNWFWKNKLESVEKLGKAGFDLIPCGSNYYDPKSFEGLVEYGDRVGPRGHLLGYLMAPWAFTLPGGTEQKNLEAIGQLGAARRQHAMRG